MSPRTRPWNSVDVLGEDGLFRYGRVVDVADHGLYIDFFCPGRRREFTPFQGVFLNDDGRYMDKNDRARTNPPPELLAEVLVRDSTSSAWTWFPAQIVMREVDIGRAKHAVAVIHHGKPEKCEDVVPLSRIRWKKESSTQQSHIDAEIGNLPKCVAKGTFVKRALQLPESCPIHLVTAVLKEQKSGTNYQRWYAAQAECVDMVDGCVVYIQRRCGAGVESDDIYLTKELENLNKLHRALIDTVSQISEPLAPILAVDEVAVLPTELWTEVFSYLDTVTQSKLRTVGAKWNALLDSDFLKANIVVDGAALSFSDLCELGQTYFMIAALFKRLSPSTHHIIIANRGEWLTNIDIFKVLDILNFIALRNAGIRLKAIFLVGLKISLLRSQDKGKQGTQCRYHKNLSAYASNPCPLSSLPRGNLRCDEIHLIRCNITVARMDGWKLNVKIMKSRQRINGRLDYALWSAMEAGLLAPSLTEFRRLSNWLKVQTGGLRGSSMEYTAMICKTLCVTQTADPRPSLHYRGKKWCVDGLQGLNVEKLSRLAMHFLIHLMNALSR
ncbi:uncharacterized protein LOC129601798 [Paramacrobiotus metropolitanus]|uniref:uncharacterized protein LOC129601798 n=1 Tax=Paramacrobiotus metropolitanus TaxID=2943436 RepID=UPI002445A4A6|nr:uncharacterized protein LOC129601798 [Paramacrobiotus metropolitanus]